MKLQKKKFRQILLIFPVLGKMTHICFNLKNHPVIIMMMILTELSPVHSPPPLHQASVFCWNPVANCNIGNMMMMMMIMVVTIYPYKENGDDEPFFCNPPL